MKTVKKKDMGLIKEVENLFSPAFDNNEKSGKYILDAVIKTKDLDFALDFWGAYRQYLPKDSGKKIQKLSKSIYE